MSDSVLVVIDMQEKLLPLVKDWETVLRNVEKLVKVAKILGMEVLATEQYPKGLGRTVPELVELLPVLIEKTTFSCFLNSDFVRRIRDLAPQTLILTGIETHVCVIQTALDAFDYVREVVVPADATGSRNELDKEIALQRMRAKGVDVVTTEMLIFDLVRDASRPEFREILKIIKGEA